MDGALLSDQDLGLSYPTPAPAGAADDGADLPAITVHRQGWRPAPVADIDPAAQPSAPAPIGQSIPGSAPVAPAQFGGAAAAQGFPPASVAAAASPKLLSDDDLGIVAPKTPGSLTNAPDDSLASSATKGAATTIIKGLSHIPGMFGDAMDFGDYLIARGVAKVTGRPVEDTLKEEAEATKKSGWSDPRNFLPSGQQIAAPVLDKTGEYVPTSQPGKLLMAGGETALGAMVGGGGLTHLATNALAGAAGQEVSDVTQDPLLGAAAGIGVGPLAHGGVAGVKKVAGPAVMGVPGIDRVPVVGPAVAAARDNAAARQIVGQASDPSALIQFAKTPVEPAAVPGAPQTLAGAVGNDRGLFQAEKDARNVNNLPFNAIDTAQSQTHQAAIAGAQPTGDVFRPGQMIVDQHNAIDQAVDRAHATLARRFQDDAAQATQAAQDGAAPLAELPPPEQTGSTLRAAQQEATDAARDARSAMYKAVDPDGTLATVVTPLKQAKAGIAAAIDRHAGVQPSGAEARIWSDIDKLPDVIPFKSLQTLDSRVTAAMADARRNPSADDPQALSRLTQLKSATMAAIHDGVENQAAHEAKLVELGLLAPENALDGRLAGHLTSYFQRQQTADLGKVSGAVDGAFARGPAASSRVSRAKGAGDEGSGDDRRAGGPSPAARGGNGQPEVTAALGAEARAFGDRTISAQMHAPETAAALGQDVPGTLVRPFSGPLDARTNLPQGIVAYHGTPHDFDRFSSEHIGSGEGAQAYGHGLYFAQNEGVAKGYRDTLSGRNADMMLSGVPISRSQFFSPAQHGAFDHIKDAGGDIDKAIAEARGASLKSQKDPAVAAFWDQRLGMLQDWKDQGFSLGGEGHLYQVRLNRDPDHFLDWDRPFSQQSEHVKNALETAGLSPQYEYAGLNGRNEDAGHQLARMNGLTDYRLSPSRNGVSVAKRLDPKGADLYLAAGRASPQASPTSYLGDRAAGAKLLANNGVAGIRYLDGGSRGAGDGSRNYVTFNDHDIIVTHKNGVPLVRPVSLPDYLHGQASASFKSELADAGMSHAAFSPELQSRAGRLLADGRTLDHGRALENAHGDDYAAFRQSLSPASGGAAADRGSASGSEGRGLKAGIGRGGAGEAGGSQGQDLRPNFDAGASERLNAAKAAHAYYAQTFKNPTVKGALETNGFSGQYKTPASAIPGKWVIPGDRGYETAQAFLKASNSDPRAVSAMQDAALGPLRKNIPPIGTIHPNALARWKEAYSGALRALDEVSPGFSSRFDTAANATQAMLDLGIQQKQALQDFQRRAAAAAIGRRDSAAGQFADKVGGSIAPTEVENAVGNMLKTGTEGASRMRSLVSSVTADADGLAGLRKAGIDWMLRSFQNADGSLSGAKFISFVRNNRDTLKELYPTSQVSMFGAIADRVEADAKWRTETAVKGGSDTAKNIKPMLEKAVDETKKHISIMGAATGGFIAGGPKGAATGAALFLLNHLRSAGIRSVDDLYREALVNPDTARFLISKMPEAPDGGKLRALAGALRRNLVVGSVQTQQAPR